MKERTITFSDSEGERLGQRNGVERRGEESRAERGGGRSEGIMKDEV